ncbi:hypothetical protein [Rhizobium sp. YS-1r]|nr:hypothetical protein [Rhizobium sp. YS-1r]
MMFLQVKADTPLSSNIAPQDQIALTLINVGGFAPGLASRLRAD